MVDPTPTTEDALQNDSSNDGDDDYVLFEFLGLESINSLHRNDFDALLSLGNHLQKKKKKDKTFLLACEVIDGRVVSLGIDGLHYHFHYFYPDREGGNIICCDLQTFNRTHGRRTSLVNTQSLHQSMAFSKATELSISSRPQTFESILSWMKENPLPCSKVILETGTHFESPFICLEPCLDWMTHKNLPNLQDLVLGNDDVWDSAQMEDILLLLGRLDDHLSQQMSTIRICNDYKMSESHFETLLIEVLPRFPNLSLLRYDRKIPNICEVLDRIIRRKGSTSANIKSNQLELDLSFDNMFSGDEFESLEPLLVISRFLKSFNNVHSLGECPNTVILWATECNQTLSDQFSRNSMDMGYNLLIKNAVGRRLIEGYCWSNDSGDNDNSNRNRVPGYEMRLSLPASVRPIVLKRAQSSNLPVYKNVRSPEAMKATGIYYLLREGPIFRERNQLKGTERKKLKREADSGTNK